MLFAQKIGLPAIASLAALLGLSSVQATGTVERHDVGTWFRVCAAGTRPMDGDACFTHKELTVSGFEVGEVGILSYKGTINLLAIIPYDAAPPEGVDVDGASSVRFQGSLCGAWCCFAKSKVDSAFLDKLKSGTIMHYKVPDITGTMIIIPVTLPGFLNPILIKRGPEPTSRSGMHLTLEIFEKCLPDLIH
jgi:invasion protein IalB